MIQINRLILNPFQENTYIIYDQTKEAVIIDPGCHSQLGVDEIKKYVSKNNLKIKYLIITHGHIDHVIGIQSVKEVYQVDCLAHVDELTLIKSVPSQAIMFGFKLESAPKIDRTFRDGDIIEFGNSKIEVIHTPGHSKGGVCYFIREQKILITGDTLFRESIGRTDLLGGNYETLIQSIVQKILPLGDDVTIYPGHGDSTTIKHEKARNPFLPR